MTDTQAKKIAVKKIGKSWAKILWKEFKKPYMKKLSSWIAKKYKTSTIYPPSDKIFKAYRMTPYEDVKVVILGQDPYHDGSATGLAFANNSYNKISPSLRNIFKELENDIGFHDIQPDPSLEHWAEQGVLLLNTSLTVDKANPDSHRGKGWGKFTLKTLKAVTNKDHGCVFILWGNHAKAYEYEIDIFDQNIIKSSHPSPYSAHISFLGSKPFSDCNRRLEREGLEPIKWQ